jgi:hypothetical protein
MSINILPRTNTNQHEQRQDAGVKVRGVRVRTVGHLKVPLLLFQTAAFIGATLCDINDLHGFTVHLFSAW